MSKTLTFFYRKKNAVFFSIEQVFERIAQQLAGNYSSEFELRERALPRPTKLQNLLPNLLFARKTQSDINHITGDIHYALLGFSRHNINILTIHDCVLLKKFSRWDPRFWLIKWVWHVWPIRKADCVTVISENTKADLLHFIGCDPGKIRVIPNFIDPAFARMARSASSFRERPRILFIGTTPNKNLDRLCEAIEGLSVDLDIIGKLTEEQLARLRQHGITFSQSFNLSREELLQHYRDCDLLAFPTTLEGFGLPIIEGQAAGLPVLTSDLSPMREVAGTGACLIDPYQPGSIREGLLRIIGDEAYRDRLIEAGSDNVRRYDLDAVVLQYVELYRELQAKK
ncbi:MAG TPA: glycosyltransferase family 1 protein [Puia sp.]|jgi:glycosyltransferase involved in cell wall biosynthesis|nr:glycosyltransferase family 1 protein [Puia sp.]